MTDPIPGYEAFRHVAIEKLRPLIEFWAPEHLDDGRTHYANAMGASGLKGNVNTSMNWVQFCSCGTVFVADVADVRATLGADEETEPAPPTWDLVEALGRIEAQVRGLIADVTR